MLLTKIRSYGNLTLGLMTIINYAAILKWRSRRQLYP